jgi:hypothetical protein
VAFRGFKPQLCSSPRPGGTFESIPGYKDIEGNKTAGELAEDGVMMETRCRAFTYGCKGKTDV